MKLIQGALSYLTVGLSNQVQRQMMIRTLCTGSRIEVSQCAEAFEQRIFGDPTENNPDSLSFEKLNRAENAFEGFDFGSRYNSGNRSKTFDGLDESFNTLSDGMDGKLKKAASYFEVDEDEVEDENYTYRPDVNIHWGGTYETKDLDLRRPGVWKPAKRDEFKVSTEEVLRKADFRNVRFLANFITDAGVIIKRSKTKISAKAQRKVAREIKTARAFGLMPFTTMGTKHFAFGRTMEKLDEDYEFETYHGKYDFVDDETSRGPL